MQHFKTNLNNMAMATAVGMVMVTNLIGSHSMIAK
jgi:hypothetical protein